MTAKGYTLLELLITLSLIAILFSIGIPSFNKQLAKSRTKTATLTLLDAIETTRATAVFRNTRIVLLAKDKEWHKGWILFVDPNNNGRHDNEEEIVAVHNELQGVHSNTTEPVKAYLSFIGTGEGKKANGTSEGAFLSGTINICPDQYGSGYALILSKGGRTRVEQLSAADCKNLEN